MTQPRIVPLLDQLNAELKQSDARGELSRLGGAVMTLVLQSRDATHDLDTIFEPKQTLLGAAERIATAEA